jgi:endoglucanase
MGNLIGLKRGRAGGQDGRVMVAAHLDEIAFIVTHIDDKGFLRFHTLGGFDAKTLVAQRVWVHGRTRLPGVLGTKPIHVMSQEERTKMPKISDFFIDLGLPKDKVDEQVSVGDIITWDRELIEIGDCVSCKSIDNRISVFILIEALRQLSDLPCDVYAVFTVQEEVGLRGASVAAHHINPDFGIGLDTTVAYDLPGAQPQERVTVLGEGAAIKIMDSSALCDYRMIAFLKKTAADHQVKWQPEILTAGGTDTAGLQRMGEHGAITGAISVPTRHLHQVTEMAHKQDVDAAIALLVAALKSLDTYDWSH